MERFLIVILPCLVYLSLIGMVITQVPIPTCTEIGFFEIYDGTCKNYYFCINDGEKLVQIILTCASSALFDPTKGMCQPANMTTCLQTTTTTTTMMPTTEAPCVRYGRFPILDPSCKRYYFCYWNGIGYTKMNNLTCPNTLLFEPTSEKCVPPGNYVCPGIVG